MSKTLVAYFSASGVTAKLAKTLSSVTDADLFEIKPVTPYTAKDLDWMDKKSRSTIEMQDKASRPEMAEKLSSCAQYDTVFVGFPIWWYEAPHIIETFLERRDLSGKTVVPFGTSGGSSMGKTAQILAPSCPGAKVLSGKVLRASSSEAGCEGVGRKPASGITAFHMRYNLPASLPGRQAVFVFQILFWDFSKFYPPGELKMSRAI